MWIELNFHPAPLVLSCLILVTFPLLLNYIPQVSNLFIFPLFFLFNYIKNIYFIRKIPKLANLHCNLKFQNVKFIHLILISFMERVHVWWNIDPQKNPKELSCLILWFSGIAFLTQVSVRKKKQQQLNNLYKYKYSSRWCCRHSFH